MFWIALSIQANENPSRGGIGPDLTTQLFGDLLVEAVTNGSIPMQRLVDMATRSIAAWYKTGAPTGVRNSSRLNLDPDGSSAALIRSQGAAATVLLKNTNCVLPLKSPDSLTVFGWDATYPVQGPYTWQSLTSGQSTSTFAGTLAQMKGSGTAIFPYIIPPLSSLQMQASKDTTNIQWVLDPLWTPPPVENATNLLAMGGVEMRTIEDFASEAQISIVFINSYAGEGSDRLNLHDPTNDQLVNRVASNCNNTIVVIHSAGIYLVDQWIENENVTGVLFAGLPGQETGNSLLDVLYGSVNPSGRLPFTIAKNESDYNTQHTTDMNGGYPGSYFEERTLVDYRYFDAVNKTPRFEFGFGLSYSKFQYSAVSIATVGSADGARTPQNPTQSGGNPALYDVKFNVSVEVTNIGDLPGNEVAQLYLGFPIGADQPPKQLRGFDRVFIQPGQTATASFPIRRKDISTWDTTIQDWVVPNGTFTAFVGASSRDIRCLATFAFLKADS